jgi:sec-independent protein translocase protein TatB
MWLRKIRRGFSDIKREVEQELHNDSVLQELRQTGSDLKNEVDNISGDLKNVTASVSEPAVGTDVSSRAQRQDNSGND